MNRSSLTGRDPSITGKAGEETSGHEPSLSGKEGLLHVADSLHHADAAVRTRAAFALAELGDDRALHQLLEIMVDESEHINTRVRAAHALGRLSEAGLIGLLGVLLADNTVWRARDLAVKGLGAAAESHPELIGRIVPVLLDTVHSDRVRYALSTFDVLEAIARRDASYCSEIVTGLITLVNRETPLRDTPPDQRDLWQVTQIAAAYSLGEIGSPDAVPALLDILEPHYSFSGGIVTIVVEALGKIGDPRAVPALVGELRYAPDEGERFLVFRVEPPPTFPGVPALAAWPHGSGRDPVRQAEISGDAVVVFVVLKAVRKEHTTVSDLMQALRQIGGLAVTDALIDILRTPAPADASRGIPPLRKDLKEKENEKVQARATMILRELGDAADVPNLLEALKDPSARVRATVACALGGTGNGLAVPALMTALKDSTAEVRAEAAAALGRLGDEIAIAALKHLLDDPDATVWVAASEALTTLGDPPPPLQLLGRV